MFVSTLEKKFRVGEMGPGNTGGGGCLVVDVWWR